MLSFPTSAAQLKSKFKPQCFLESVSLIVLFSNGCRPITCMKWLPENNMYESTDFTSQKLIIGTADGRLLCVDVEGKLFAATQLDSPALCVDTDGKIFVGGCTDGSVRVWVMKIGKLHELCRFAKIHSGAVTAIALGSKVEIVDEHQRSASNSHRPTHSEIMVSGSEDCSIRVWRIGYEK